jgi:hypothetical protein
MGGDLSKKTDEQLIADAGSGQESYQRVSVEVARRLRISLDALRRSSDRYAWWMTVLTGILIVLTLVIAALTAALVYKEF